jgi:hypothetical protein
VGNRVDRLIGWPAPAHPLLIVPRTIAVAVVCWGTAWISWRVLERPILALKRYVPMPQPAPSITLVPARPAYGEVPDDG